MNYRHAFHAGNFADVVKHVVIVRILTRLRDKAAPFRVIDTHAGAGLYDLMGAEAGRTGEWREGIGRLLDAPLPAPAADLLAPYLAAVRSFNSAGALRRYPGSPLIARALLRPQDSLIACELEPGSAAALAGHLRGAAKVMERDGWTALNALVPPRERRGLVVIDPPFEEPDEFRRLTEAAVTAWRKWATGIYLVWYPLKAQGDADRFARALRRAGIEKGLRFEFSVAAPVPSGALSACGMVIVNPPWRLAGELCSLAPVLEGVLAKGPGAGLVLENLAGETVKGG